MWLSKPKTGAGDLAPRVTMQLKGSKPCSAR